MALNPDKDLRRYYNISEVAQMFGISESTLRFWEKEFPQISPQKPCGKIRRYTKEDVEQVRLVYTLVKVRGLKIAAAREALRKNKRGTVAVADVVDRLTRVKAELVAMRDALGALG